MGLGALIALHIATFDFLRPAFPSAGMGYVLRNSESMGGKGSSFTYMHLIFQMAVHYHHHL